MHELMNVKKKDLACNFSECIRILECEISVRRTPKFLFVGCIYGNNS